MPPAKATTNQTMSQGVLIPRNKCDLILPFNSGQVYTVAGKVVFTLQQQRHDTCS